MRSSLLLATMVGSTFFASAVSAAEIRHCTFSAQDYGTMEPVGSTSNPSNLLQLTPAAAALAAGAAWEKTKVALTATTSFHTHFIVRFDSPGGLGGGGDGMTFVLQNMSQTAVGGTGGGMGYTGITSSVAVEFDTFDGSADNDSNHVAMMSNGTLTVLATAQPSFEMKGATFHAWIDYDAGTHTLSAYVDPTSTKPATALVSTTIDLFATVGSAAWVGFTGATANAFEAHQVQQWVFTTDSVLVDCQPCTTNPNCTVSPYLTCDPTGWCHRCSADADCPTTTAPHCTTSRVCAPCVADASCSFRAGTTVCRPDDGACVECTTGKTAACVSPEPICRIDTASCVECASRNDCPTVAKPACTNDVCATCATDPDCSRFAGTPRCVASTCVGCIIDQDCGSSTSGKICQTNACVDGCRGTGGNGCPVGKVCTSVNAAAGTCITPLPDAGPDTADTADTADARDTAVQDTFVPDTFVPDTFVPDTFVPDTFVPDTFDAFVPDTLVADTEAPDTVQPDTLVEDMFVPDTFVPDTFVEDTTVPDTTAADTLVADTSIADASVDAFVEPEEPTDAVLVGGGCGCGIPARATTGPLAGLAAFAAIALRRRSRRRV